MVNYAINPVWQRHWEQHLLDRNGLQITSGSVTTEDLYTDLMLNISEPVSTRFRFLYRSVWREGRHLDTSRQENWLGFEIGLGHGLATYTQIHPTPDKEELDLLIGFQLSDKTRQKYIRLGLRLDDFRYEHKNDLGGVSTKESVGMQWESRFAAGAWEAFFSGRYDSGFERVYPDSIRSPLLAKSCRQDANSTWKIRYVISNTDFLGLEVDHYRFKASDDSRAGSFDFEYSNEFAHLCALGVWGFKSPWVLRPEFHWLKQWSTAEGALIFTHQREDFFPAVFVEWHSSDKSIWELGYMAVHYQWDYSTESGIFPHSDYTDKIKLGWTYAFQETAQIQFSLSHELDLQRFGGGNIQFQIIY